MPNTTGIAGAFVRALEGPDEVPDFPRREDGTLTYRGEAIDKTEEEGSRKEASRIVLNKLKELWQSDTDELVGKTFYGRIGHKGEYANIITCRWDLPADAELVDPSDFRFTPTVAGMKEDKADDNGEAPRARRG